jgi:hypothetical protein
MISPYTLWLLLCGIMSIAALPGKLHADSVVVFNEIQYHPELTEKPEWIELHNQMAINVDVSHWRLAGGVDYVIPAGTVVPAGGYLLISGNPAGLGAVALGPWEGQLNNDGERLRLHNNSGRLMNEIEFGDSGVWPVGADGSGATLAKADEGTGSADPANWRASAEVGGTPGAQNFSIEVIIGPPTQIFGIDSTWRFNESGADLDTDWALNAHPAWPTGAGLLGFETTAASLPETLVTIFVNPRENDILTYYFEIDFELTAEQVANIDSLILRHVIDDGAVFYINGTEILPRFNMDPGAVDASTTSGGSVSNANYEGPIILPTNALVTGTNRFSVEVHQQSSGSSDIIFGANLSMTQKILPIEKVPLVISEIAGAGNASFQIEFANTGEENIDAGNYVLESRGTVDTSYTIPNTTMISAGGFLAIDEAELGFRPAKDDRLFLYSPGKEFLIHSARTKDLPCAFSAEHGGKMLVPDELTFGAPNRFDFNTDIVINEIMYHFREDSGSDGISSMLTLIPIEATWRYNESGADLGSNWERDVHLVDNFNWFSGPALLGSETATASMPEPLRTNFAPSATNSIVTYYFETEFVLNAKQKDKLQALQLRHIIDDGAIFFLNGVEVYRFNLPNGAIGVSTTASPGVPNARYQGPFAIPPGSLVVGSNRLSVEVHQQFSTSSDIIFGAELVAVTAVPTVPIIERDEEWIELFNKGNASIDITGWSINDGIDFNFPEGTSISAGDFLVVAENPTSLVTKYPSIAGKIVGNYRNRLSNTSDTIRLEDGVKNPVDEVRYFEGGRWSALADGNGSSLELRDPDADNSSPQAWAASDESNKTQWQTISYRSNGSQSYGLTSWNEFRLGMLRAGEVLIDDVSVVRDPDGAAQELIQNGSFSSGATKWRILGNHRHSNVIPEPGNPGNNVLHLNAKGATDTRHNHLETTFINNSQIFSGQIYEVTFLARWLAGSNQINSHCYYQRLARTTQLDRPENCGTPGAANSQFETNIGPTFGNLRHDPPVPAANEFIEITADVSDPDGLADFVLKARFDEGSVQPFNFFVDSDGHGRGLLTGQPSGTVIQFWIEAADALGIQSFAPEAGPDSRALIQVDNGQGSNLAVPEVRLIMLDSERNFMLSNLNLMSNERLGGTTIYNRREIFYNAGVRLRGSGAGRARDGSSFRGFNIGLPADQLFRGIHDSLSIDRSARTPVARQQHEIFVKHMFNHAGIPCMYDELIHLVGPSSTYTGTSQMLMAGYGGLFTGSQFSNDSNGSVFNLDITYDPVSSIGGTEGLKPPIPFTHMGTDMRDLGDSKEDYRASFEIRTGRRRDDYSGLINFCKIFDLPAAQLAGEIGEWMDVDEWCRYTAMTLLCGIGDTFVQGGLRHNIRIYVPENGRGVTALPWDMDFVFNSGTNSSMLPGGGNLSDVINIPKYRRLYWGHVQDLVNTTFNTTYMSTWLAHYGNLVSQNFGSQSGYINARGNFALSQLPSDVEFNVTTNGGNNFSVADTSTVIEGKGWINIRQFRLAGNDAPLAVEWLNGDTWRMSLPLLTGANSISLETYDFQDNLLGTHNLTITSTVTRPTPPEFLRITEIHYNPALPTTPAELAVSNDPNEFEFIEFKNIGTEPLNVGGVHFQDGISFTFPSGTTVPADGYVVAVRNRVAFEARYGQVLPVVGEYPTSNLRNNGEQLDLRDEPGNVIQQFAYGDSDWYPATDGGGRSLHIRDANAADIDSWGNPLAWGISAELHGNPGTPNTSFGMDFQSWQTQHFTEAERNSLSISKPLVDLNSDGTSNLLKYAFGLDPRVPNPPGSLPTTAMSGGHFHFSFRRQKNAADLDYIAETSRDLLTWHAMTIQIGSANDNGDGTETLTLRDDEADELHTKKFFRLRVNFLFPEE